LSGLISHPIGEDGEDELPGLESVDDSLDESAIRLHRNVALEAHVRKLWLGGDVDGHVLTLAKNSVLTYRITPMAS